MVGLGTEVQLVAAAKCRDRRADDEHEAETIRQAIEGVLAALFDQRQAEMVDEEGSRFGNDGAIEVDMIQSHVHSLRVRETRRTASISIPRRGPMRLHRNHVAGSNGTFEQSFV
ncbi:hypothetical protein D3C71_1786240 [compost metagenome]